jgi:hypothetical protein
MDDKKAVVMFRCTPEEKRLLKTLAARHYTTMKGIVLGLAQELDREPEESVFGFGLPGNDYFHRGK